MITIFDNEYIKLTFDSTWHLIFYSSIPILIMLGLGKSCRMFHPRDDTHDPPAGGTIDDEERSRAEQEYTREKYNEQKIMLLERERERLIRKIEQPLVDHDDKRPIVKCSYCGKNNLLSELNCKFCGASLPIDRRVMA
mgnify:CR=1 FL=1